MERMLLDAARLNVRIRQEYARLKRDPAARYYTYVLLLQRGKLYCGSSDNIFTRLLDHTLGTPSAALWVREHGPIQRVVEISRNCARDDETYKTLEYMSMFGWENVRGAGWCKVDMHKPPTALDSFARDPVRPMEYMTRRDVEAVWTQVQGMARELSSSSDQDM